LKSEHNIENIAVKSAKIDDTVKEQLNKLADDFEKEYGTLLLLKANLVVINKMLIKRGKEKELYDLFKETIDNFKEKNKKDCIIDKKE